MLVTESRPRNLRWFHAGPLLYGDWGTSRLYVLGLAFYYAGHASIYYLGVMSLIMAAVAWAYTIICRCFPEGGGVYTAARQINPYLSLIGATLLLCGYIMTVAISVIEALHYFGVPRDMTLVVSAVAITGIGVVNWLGAKRAGQFALVIAFVSLGASLAIAAVSIPYIAPGLKTSTFNVPGTTSLWERWTILVAVVLALSGVESVANMTGLMRRPVARTSKRTIWPVLIEVVVLNMIFGIAIAGLPALTDVHQPAHITHIVEEGIEEADLPAEVVAYKDTAMKVLAIEAGQRIMGENAGYIFGKATAIVFGMLLLSAANTAIMATVSVLFSMAQDRELPKGLATLNYSGVPWVGLVVACVIPVAVLAVDRDVTSLAKLYAVGVCGAITINILSCAANRALEIGRFERGGLLTLGLFTLAVESTILLTQFSATAFAGGLVLAVLGVRYGLRRSQATVGEPMPEPVTGWLAEIKADPARLDSAKPRIMLAARGRSQSEFAVDLARRRGAVLFAIYVRTLRVMDVQPGRIPRVEEDPGAQAALGTTAILARQAGVPFVPIYITATDIAEEILDYTVTYGCDTLIMGKSRRNIFARTIEGDVVSRVASLLPEDVALIKRSETPYTATETVRKEPSNAASGEATAGDSSDEPPPT